MAKGQKIDELYISLGLDIARLQLDFDTAGKTVSETVSRLNSQNYQLKLKTDIDLAKLEGAGRELDRLKVKYEAVNRQLDIQRQKEEILANVLKAAQKTDPDSSHTRYAASNLLRQQKEVAQLEAELRKLTAQMKTAGTTGRSMGEKITVGLDAAKSGVSRLSSGFSLLSAKTAAFLAVCTTGAGLFNITHDAMQAGENIYRLTQRLHTTSAEAAQLSRVFSLAGTSIDGVIPLFARLDKQVAAAGEDGNNMTEALTRFGITLTNETGQLLPLNEQLAQLAQGYKNAAAAGEEEAFTAEVLGARGAALIPVLEQYEELMEISSHVKTTGLLNPEEAHQTYLKWREMEMEAGQLRLALGSALLPVAEDLMPSVIGGFQDVIESIRENKVSIEELAGVMGTFAQTSVDVIKGVADAMRDLGVNSESVKETLSDIGTLSRHGGMKEVLSGALVGAGAGAVAGSFAPVIGTGIGAAGGAIVGALGTYELGTGTEKFQEWKKADEALEQEKKAAREAEEALRKNSRAQEDNARTARANAAAVKAAAKASEELKESLFSLTHSELETSLHEAERQAEKYRKSGADAALADAYLQQKRARIYEDFETNVLAKVAAVRHTALENQLADIDREATAYRRKGLDEAQAASWAEERKAQIREAFEEEAAAKIDSIYHTALENRLAEIEREKKAWIEKGLEEVRATKWAEKEKLDAKRSAALEVLQSQKEEFQAYLTGGERGLADYYKAAHGFTMDDLAMTPEQLAGFQKAQKHMLENLLPNFRDPEEVAREKEAARQSFSAEIEGRTYSYNEILGGLSEQFDEKMRQLVPQQGGESRAPQMPEQQAPQVQIAVNIENAVTQDNEGMRLLADQVADRIRPAVENALGGGENTYSNW
ncbi:hypothetical protein HF878_07815 [Selenomonas bovis]|uniref:Phage tail tape measure protein n=1 Tax=Selenomonas bovis TaxID=416586 RepID=A0A848B612_9FIRM|nr:hypothetical protein [Selenomonas bovis]NMD99373.1 hypothetical protein [Selenomonas bovis]